MSGLHSRQSQRKPFQRVGVILAPFYELFDVVPDRQIGTVGDGHRAVDVAHRVSDDDRHRQGRRAVDLQQRAADQSADGPQVRQGQHNIPDNDIVAGRIAKSDLHEIAVQDALKKDLEKLLSLFSFRGEGNNPLLLLTIGGRFASCLGRYKGRAPSTSCSIPDEKHAATLVCGGGISRLDSGFDARVVAARQLEIASQMLIDVLD